MVGKKVNLEKKFASKCTSDAHGLIILVGRTIRKDFNRTSDKVGSCVKLDETT